MGEEISSLQTSIEARDDTIMALGEKLAAAHAKNSKPFYFCGNGLEEEVANVPSLLRVGEEEKWTCRQ